jgi:hypothetical protein
MTQTEIFNALSKFRSEAFRGDEMLDEYFDRILGDVASILGLSPEQVAIIGNEIAVEPVVAPIVESVPVPVLDPREYEITDGHVGSWGVTWETATEETLRDAIDQAVTRNKTTMEKIVYYLQEGKNIGWCDSPNHYYDHGSGIIRRKQAPKAPEKLVKCSCGHSVPRAQVMSASLGSSCPDCYDRMSG